MKQRISGIEFVTVMGTIQDAGKSVQSVTKYLSASLVIRATWQRKPSSRHKSENIIVTIGAPNYREREFIKLCKKAGEKFPLRKIQLRPYPKPRKKK